MTSRTFVVRVADLEDGPQRLSCLLPSAWLARALADTEAKPRDGGRQDGGKLDVELSLNGREVVVRGTVEAALEMPCSITLDPVPVDVRSEVFLLLAPRAAAARAGRRPAPAPQPDRAKDERTRGRAGAQPGSAEGRRRDRHRRSEAEGAGSWSEDSLLGHDDAARDTYDGDEVVLDEFLREFIVLELPMNPRRSDLRSDEDVAIALRSAGLATADEPSLDPRLAPLAAIASRLRQKKE